MNRFRYVVPIAIFSLFSIAAKAEAVPFTIQGVSGPLSTASGDLLFNAATNTITFSLTNTSAISSPGSTATITGIGFDLPPLGNASASGLNGFTGSQTPSLTSTFDFSDGDLGNVPAGFNIVVLDFGYTTGPSGNFNGGSVNDGLLPGESAAFQVTGAAFTGFTENQIAGALFVRFQNVPEPVGSDVGTSTVSPPNPPTVTPEPASLFLLGSGVLVAANRIRRRKSS